MNAQTGSETRGRALFEVGPSEFRRSWHGTISGLAAFVGIGGPSLLFLVTVTTPGASISAQFVLIAGIFALFGVAVYLLAVPLNRFGIYEAALAPTRRSLREGLRLGARQWLVPYAEVTRITRHGAWAENRRPHDQTWYFIIERADKGQVVLPAAGVWEAISPALRVSKTTHRERLRLAYDALTWVATKLSAAKTEAGPGRVSEAEFATHRTETARGKSSR